MPEQTFKVGDKANYVGKPVTIAGGPFTGYSEWYVVKGEDGKEHPAAASGLAPAFAIGDEVKYEYGGGGKLVAGPFRSEHHDELLWVVEKANGTHMTPTQNSLTKVEPDTIKVGDRVRVVADDPESKPGQFVGMTGTVFNIDDDDLPYGVRFDADQGAPVLTWYVTRVTKLSASDSDAVTHDGVTYELGADYEDRDGDRWKFARVDGEIFGDWGFSRNHITSTSGCGIAYAVSQYGPFTLV
ncbi:phiSA1p31-related protein [Streptomyces lydicus]|uniref:phiSA1p31-related protein n=1 Tax=Streptomyces lydicus TaxID=47763 RepID=UPI00378846D0